MKSKQDYGLLVAVEKGYYIKGGAAYSKAGRARKTKLMAGYPCFTIKLPKAKTPINVYCHRLVGLGKFGNTIFDDNLEVRHKNADRMDFSEDNILIGTKQENMLDVPKAVRTDRSIKASSFLRKLSNEQVEELREMKRQGVSRDSICEKFNLPKRTYYHALNHDYVT